MQEIIGRRFRSGEVSFRLAGFGMVFRMGFLGETNPHHRRSTTLLAVTALVHVENAPRSARRADERMLLMQNTSVFATLAMHSWNAGPLLHQIVDLAELL